MKHWGVGTVLVAAIAVGGCFTDTSGVNGGGAGGDGGTGGVGGAGGVGGSTDPCVGGFGPCDPAGTFECIDINGMAECSCNTGYEGPLCDECLNGFVRNPMSPAECILDPCGSDPCNIGGGSGSMCTVDGPDAYTCSCNFPFDGRDCQCNTAAFEFPDGMGGCWVCTGTPTSGIFINFPTSGAPAPVLQDATDGFRVTAGADNITFNNNGLGADQIPPDYDIRTGESLTFSFFESNGVTLTTPRTVSNLEIYFIRFDFVEVQFTALDRVGNTLGPVSSTMGTGFVDVSALFGEVGIQSVTAAPIGPTVVQVMRYDHDCL